MEVERAALDTWSDALRRRGPAFDGDSRMDDDRSARRGLVGERDTVIPAALAPDKVSTCPSPSGRRDATRARDGLSM